jgi:hypothetical protein
VKIVSGNPAREVYTPLQEGEKMVDGQWSMTKENHVNRGSEFSSAVVVLFSVSAVLAASLAETITMPANPANLHVLSHPLVNTRLAKLRQVSTTSKEFREVKSFTSYSDQLCL